MEYAGSAAAAQRCERLGGVVGGYDDVKEDAAHRLGGGVSERAVEGDYAAVSGYGIPVEGAAVGGGLVGVEG